MQEEFIRSQMLLGRERMEKLARSRVAIFGLGGVGSYVLEALARIGIGAFVLVDHDTISLSNINRQILATHETVGQAKVAMAKKRVLSINPLAAVQVHQEFYVNSEEQRFTDNCDYIVDAIDTVSAKIELIVDSQKKNIPLISCMGTGNKLDPTRFKIADIYQTSVCPLCRVMRKELKKRSVDSLKVLYSEEIPKTPLFGANDDPSNKKRTTPASMSFVPSVAGLIIASEVVKDLLVGFSQV